MNDVVIRAEGLGKKYVIGHQSSERYTALRDVIARQVRGIGRSAMDIIRGRPNIAGDEIEEFWALKDINFEIGRGDVVGIVGRNGAGKSTLLKILSRITEPSEGRMTIEGRVASLLEVGTGFHPELTGRENMFLNGAILGMTRAEIKRKFDEIVDFAGVEQFLDTPVKRYSSGMYVRLAFSVAAHLEPEILVVDEVLAVGDAEFQKRCLGKMRDVAGEGRTVLFVSHHLDMVSRLCERAILMSKGEILSIGGARDIIQQYTKIESGGAKTSKVRMGEITAVAGINMAKFAVDRRLDLLLSLTLSADDRLSDACIVFYSSTEQRIGLVDLRLVDEPLNFKAGIRKVCRVKMAPFPIVAGQYRVSIWLRGDSGSVEIDLGYITAPDNRRDHRLSLYPESLNGVVETFGEITLEDAPIGEEIT